MASIPYPVRSRPFSAQSLRKRRTPPTSPSSPRSSPPFRTSSSPAMAGTSSRATTSRSRSGISAWRTGTQPPSPPHLLSLLGVSCVRVSVGFSRHIQSELLDELDSIRLLQLWQNDLFSSVSSHTAPHAGERCRAPSDCAASTPLTFRFLRASWHRPVKTIRIHDFLKAKLCDLYENDCIFDKFECSLSGSGEYAPPFPFCS